MEIKNNIIDDYYKYIQNKYCCKTLDKLLGKQYVLGEQFGTGNFLGMKIEDGLDISCYEMNNVEMDFDNRNMKDDILEVGYCYSGEIKIILLPDNEEYTLREGDICIYKTLNDVNCFKIKYNNCKTMSIHMNFNVIKNAMNPIWEAKLIMDWQENINNIFNGKVLIIEKASYNLKKIAKQIDDISSDDMLGFMKLKLKTIEFLASFLEEKIDKNFSSTRDEYLEIINKAEEIINKKLDNTPSVKELASKLNTSVYKLQKGFKDITGNTVYEYIRKTKIEKAKYLLKNTNMSILEITNEVGYENPSKFANVFKRYNNITPLKYRKSK